MAGACGNGHVIFAHVVERYSMLELSVLLEFNWCTSFDL